MAITLPTAYVMGGRHTAEQEARIARGEWPRAEFNHYLSRNSDATLLHYGNLDQPLAPMAHFFQRRNQLHWSLAAQAASDAGQYGSYVATGEDIGLPLALLTWLRGKRKPVYIIAHGSYFGSDKFPKLMRLMRRNRNLHFLCLSESLRMALVDEFGVRAENAHNTSYGVDTKFFSPMKLKRSRSRPLIAAAGTATRDYATLIDAVRDIDVDVHIAADSAWFREPVNLDGRTVPENVTIQSCGDYRGLRDLYARASFVVVPLRPARHACGYAVIAEAMAMGKAVITTRTDSPGDFLVENETGFYVRPGDAEGLRLKIEALLCDRGLADEMGVKARVRAETVFSLEAYCSRIEGVVAGGHADRSLAP